MGRKKVPVAVDPDRELLKHISDLGLKSVEEYRGWCAEHGFSKRLHKHWKQRLRETSLVQHAVADARLKTKKRESRDLLGTLAGICQGRLTERDVTQDHLARFCQAVQRLGAPPQDRSRKVQALRRLLTHLHGCRARFFDGSPALPGRGDLTHNTHLEALAQIACYSRSWRRPVEAWRPATRNARRQFSSLLRHLFARYDDLPQFFDSVWFTDSQSQEAEHRDWYVHVGRGESLRTRRLPIEYTKRMAHCFMHAPHNLSVTQALRWGQVHGLGGDERLARAVLGVRRLTTFENDDFWSSVLRWFIDHPMLDRTHVGPIADYLHHQRFAPQEVLVGANGREHTPPREPNLTMRGRTPESLLRQVNRWHGRLASDNTYQVRDWPSCGIEGFEFAEGSQSNLRVWTIRELLGSKSLAAEGRKMKHCVATYASSCARGRCSIWTMEVDALDGVTKALTLEVHNQTRTISQARGKTNRLPTDKERNILTRWAAKAGLKMATYV